MYGGYFGAAQGILLLAVLGLALTESMQRVNGLKNVLATATNLVAALVFVAAAPSTGALRRCSRSARRSAGAVGARGSRRSAAAGGASAV